MLESVSVVRMGARCCGLPATAIMLLVVAVRGLDSLFLLLVVAVRGLYVLASCSGGVNGELYY